MTTASWSTVLDHTSDAGFRAWGSELNTKLAAVGMVQQSDTGQINWTTVTRPGTNAVAGYEIWKTPSGGLCLKIEYGTGGSTSSAALWLTVGTGSNGSGTLTGQTSTRTQLGINGSQVAATSTALQSYLCAKANYIGLNWKCGSFGSGFVSPNQFVVAPTVDSTGADSNTGYYVLLGPRQPAGSFSLALQTIRTLATAATRALTNSFCVMAGQPAASSDGTNNQVYLHWLDTPGVQPALYSGTIISSELTLGNTASIALIGATARTYISCGGASNIHADAAVTAGLNQIMLWE